MNRLERLKIRTWAGRAKVIGTVLGIGGAMVLTFYKGPQINIWSTKVNLLKHKDQHVAASHGELDNHVLGSILAVASCFSYAIWLIIQVILTPYFAPMHPKYPHINLLILSHPLNVNRRRWERGTHLTTLALL